MAAYEAVLHTGNRTPESIREQAAREHWIGMLTEEDIQREIQIGNHLEGVRAVVIEREEKYSFCFWSSEDDAKVKEAIYLMEQDPIFGVYDDRESFDTVWAAGEYCPGGGIGFCKEEVEITGPIGSTWTKAELIEDSRDL